MVLRKAFLYLLMLTGLLFLLLVYLSYHAAFRSNIKKSKTPFALYVDGDDSQDSVYTKLDTVLKHPEMFKNLCCVLGLEKIRTGHYILNDGTDNFTLFKRLRNGQQDPVSLTFNNVRDIYSLCGVLGAQLMADSSDFLMAYLDSATLNKLQTSQEQIMSFFIPNTYQVYWNVSPDKLLYRILDEHDLFWNKNSRKEKAAQKQLSLTQVYTLASIVEKETNLEDEKGLIAGVYLNRLKSGMKLQADPTVVFALGRTDVYRVLLEHLKIDSPFNTYLYDGLPPGPIWMPSISSIDSVLNCQEHSYIFFCAKPGYEGRHAFAETMHGHSQNAVIYRKWLNKENIR